jgi:hypothetical protein
MWSGVVLMRDWWSTRWYTPIVLLGALLLVLLIAGLAAMEHFASDAHLPGGLPA